MTLAGEQKQLTFEAQDIRTAATMLDGDKIKFNISTHRETKKERAVNINISPETFAESTEQRRTVSQEVVILDLAVDHKERKLNYSL